MPRLPIAEDLGRRSFQNGGSVVRAPQIDMSGNAAIAETIGGVASKMSERLDATSLHKAKTHFQKRKLELDSEFDQDPDFETYLHRIGRTGRFGKKGTAINLIDNVEDIQVLAAIENHFAKEGSEMISQAEADPEKLADVIEI